jgi:hypothetical protein
MACSACLIAIAAIDRAEAGMKPEVNRRQPANRIDYDFYRRRAVRIRTEAVRELGKPLRIGLLAAGIIAALLIAANVAHRVYCPPSAETSAVKRSISSSSVSHAGSPGIGTWFSESRVTNRAPVIFAARKRPCSIGATPSFRA